MHHSLPDGVFAGNELSLKCGLFASPKSRDKVTYRRRWHADGLKQLSLEEQVKSLRSYRGKLAYPGGVETLVKAELAEGTVYVGYAETPCDISTFNDKPFLVFTKADVECEPRCTTVRAIWSCRQTIIDPADRIRVLTRLASHPDGLPIEALSRLVRWSAEEPVHAIMAMVVEGVLSTGTDQPISPEMVIRRARTNADQAERRSAKILPGSAQLVLPLHEPAIWAALDIAAGHPMVAHGDVQPWRQPVFGQ